MVVSRRALIELLDVSKEYRVGEFSTVALKGITFRVYESDLVAIMGPSGSGKTTLLNMLGLLDRPTKGRIFFEERDVSKLSDRDLANLRNRKIGFVFQNFNLINRLTVFENVELPLIPRGIPRSVRAEMVKEAIFKVGGDSRWLEKKPNQLSGGQQQRVAIARAIVGNPPIILADEPTGNLDRVSARTVIETFLNLNKEGHSIIIVTHDPEVANCTEKIYIIRDGAIVGEYEANPKESLVAKVPQSIKEENHEP